MSGTLCLPGSATIPSPFGNQTRQWADWNDFLQLIWKRQVHVASSLECLAVWIPVLLRCCVRVLSGAGGFWGKVCRRGRREMMGLWKMRGWLHRNVGYISRELTLHALWKPLVTF